MKTLLQITLALLACSSATTLYASHGQNFLLLEDYDIPAPLHGQITGTFDWEMGDGTDSYATEPSLLLGLLPNTALSIAPHFGDEAGEGWAYSSITPRLHLRLPNKDFPLNLGLSFGYQFAEGHAEAEEGGEESHEEHEEEGGHHAETFSGVDNHDANLWHTRLLIETDLSDSTKVVANLIGVFPESGGPAWGYGIGLRQMVADTLALGVEARGDFDSKGKHELLAASYWSPIHDLTLRIGCGFGLTEETPDFVLRTGVIWRF